MSKTSNIANRAPVFIAVAFMGALYAFSYMQRVGVPGTIFNELQIDLNISAEQVTALSAIYLFIYASMQILTGPLVDRLGPSKVILAGGTLLSVGSLLFPLSTGLFVLYFSRGLVGLGGSLMYLSIVKELDIRFSDRSFSALLSLMVMAGYSGGLLATRPFEMVVHKFGWRASLLVVGIACAATTICAGWAFKRSPYENAAEKEKTSILDAIKNVAKNRLMYPVTFAAAISFMAFFIMQGVIGKKMLEDCCRMTSADAASLIFLMMLVSMISSVLAGMVSTAIGNRRVPLVVLVTLSSLVGLLAGLYMIQGRTFFILPFAVFLGIGSAGAPVFAASVKELNKPEFAGTSVGLMNGIVYVLISAISVFTGKVLDIIGGTKGADKVISYPVSAYKTVLMVCIVLSVISVMAAFASRETKGVNIYNSAT